MTTLWKTLILLAVAVLVPPGLVLAGRGGGHPGGGHPAPAHAGGHPAAVRSGGGSHPPVIHTPSFSVPHESRPAPHFAERPAVRPAPHEVFHPAPAAHPHDQRPAVVHAPHEEFHPGAAPAVHPRDVRPAVVHAPALGAHRGPDNRLADRRTDIVNRNYHNYVVNRPESDRFALHHPAGAFIRPTHNDWDHGTWYHGDWHRHWGNNAWYYRPLGWWSADYWGGPVMSAVPWAWGYWSYYNPYYTGPVYDGTATFDYSQPLVLDQPAVPPTVPDGPSNQDRANAFFDAARNAFLQGDHATALAQVDQAIALVPDDTLLHEFRGQAFFALGRYQEAAASEYAVLSAGPGWDWTTLSGLYPDVAIYTDQLRGLEQYVNAHPSAADARFLLADQYLTCGYSDAAAAQLRAVVQLNPKDQLSAQLLQSVASPEGVGQSAPDQQPPAESAETGPPAPPAGTASPAGPASPAPAAVNPASLVGNWVAKRPDNATVKLALLGDGKFTWELDQNGKPKQFSGTYSVADNLLILKQNEKPMMVGQVALLGSNGFNFKLAGDNPADPGLNFER